MTGGVLQEIRCACANVAGRARQVRIDESRIPVYSTELPFKQALVPSVDAVHYYLAEPDTTLAFVLTLNAINFGSGYFPHFRKRPGLSGYFTIAAALKERFERQGRFTAAELPRKCSFMLELRTGD
jgi:hypothetical protein